MKTAESKCTLTSAEILDLEILANVGSLLVNTSNARLSASRGDPAIARQHEREAAVDRQAIKQLLMA